jgi:hypothetical protein
MLGAGAECQLRCIGLKYLWFMYRMSTTARALQEDGLTLEVRPVHADSRDQFCWSQSLQRVIDLPEISSELSGIIAAPLTREHG